jgi:hypothetical protein
MPSLQHIILLALPVLSVLGANPLTPGRSQSTPSSDSKENNHHVFEELLRAVPEDSLHAALHTHLNPKYKDGVYEHDKTAVQKVHEDNPPLASKVILAAAKLELLKRQNISTPAPPQSTPAQPQPPASTEIVIPVPVTLSSTDAAGSAIVQTSSTAIPVPVTSVAVPVTATDAAGNTIVASSAAPAVVISTTDSAGNNIAITSRLTGAPPAVITPTPGQVITTTDARGSTFVTTYTPGGGRATSLVVLTETLSNGQVVTKTETVIGGADETGTAGNGGTKPTSTRGPAGLQTGAANSAHSQRWGAVIAGLLVGFGLTV